jgi:hypothetical protein
LETSWTISINGKEFVHVLSSAIELKDSTLRFDKLVRKIVEIDSMKAGAVRVKARARLRREADVLVFYPGEKLPSATELRRRRTAFQRSLVPALAKHFSSRVTKQMLYSDKQHGVGGAYPRFLIGTSHAVIAVDPDDPPPIINGIMRAAIQWSSVVKRRIAVVVPAGRSQTIATRVAALPVLRHALDWLAWDGAALSELTGPEAGAETHVHPYVRPMVDGKVDQICALMPGLLQPVPHIAGNAVSLRFRGLEVARVSESETIRLESRCRLFLRNCRKCAGLEAATRWRVLTRKPGWSPTLSVSCARSCLFGRTTFTRKSPASEAMKERSLIFLRSRIPDAWLL